MIKTFSTLGCPAATLDDVIELARRHRLNALEVRGLDGELEWPTGATRKGQTPDSLRDALAAAAVRVVVFGTSFRLMDGTAADREALLAYVPWAEALGGVYLRVFDGAHELNGPALAHGAAALQWWNDLRQRHGWKSELIVETHDTLLTAAAVQQFLTAMPRGARILWDAHHTWRKGGEDVTATWSAIAPAVAHVHVKDSVPVPSARHPYTYVLPGAGEFPMGRLQGALTRDGYAGAISLEWERRWHPQLPPLEEALAAADQGWW